MIADNVVMWETRLSIVHWVLSKAQILLETLKTKSTSGGIFLFFLEVEHVFPLFGCKSETSVSRSSTESEIISLDAGLRMDGLTALDFWDVVIEVLHYSKKETSSGKPLAKFHHKGKKKRR